jgi:pre-mRNA-processing factor 19
LIQAYISEHGTDPVNGEALSTEDLVDLKQARVVKPRPPTLTSIPALLSTFQNEWDALILETYQLKQQLAETRQELSTALYYNDSAQRVIARLQKERDEARHALSSVSVTGSAHSTNGANGDAMQVDNQPLAGPALAKVDETQQQLSSTRRKRPVPDEWATGDEIQSYDVTKSLDSQFAGAKYLAADSTGDFFLTGDSDGTMGVYDLAQGAFTTRSSLGAGAILGGAWANDKQTLCTSNGTVVVAQDGAVQGKFQQHAGAATALACHPSGELLVSVGFDKSYIVYDLSTIQVLTQVFGDVGKFAILVKRVAILTVCSAHHCRFSPRRTPSCSRRRRRISSTLRLQDITAGTYLPRPSSDYARRGGGFLRERDVARLSQPGGERGYDLGPPQTERAQNDRYRYCSHGYIVGLHWTIFGRLRARRRCC